MIDLLKKTMFAGIGLAAMSKEKVEHWAKDFAKSAELSAEKGEEFVSEVVGKSESMRQELETTVAKLVDDALEKAHVANQRDLEALTARVAELEAKLAEKS